MYSYLLKFIVVESAFQVSPGPDMALLLRASLGGNFRLAWGIVTGIMISSLLWGVASAIGLCALIAISPKIFNILAIIGICWLAWLGIQMIFSKNVSFLDPKSEEESASTTTPVPSSFFSGIVQGIMTDLLNPTTAVFTLTFFPAFIPPGYNPSYFSLILGAVMALDTLVFSGGMVFLSKLVAPFLIRPGVALWVDRIAGVIFLLLSYQLMKDTQLDAKFLALLHSL